MGKNAPNARLELAKRVGWVERSETHQSINPIQAPNIEKQTDGRLSPMPHRRWMLFFTVNLAERKRDLLTRHIGFLRQAFREVKTAHPFTIEAIVVLPDHLHALWTLPENDADFSLRWRQIKSAFSRAIEKGETISKSRARKQERGLWQRRFWEHTIRDDEDFARHVDYIHYNPVKHGHVSRVSDWPYSSFHRFVRLGILPENWLGTGHAQDVDKL